jgi:ABC-type Fe3+-siderophore transport system permease subunit
MPGDYSTVLITVGSLACFGAFGWFLESAADQSELNEDHAPEDSVQQQRARVYMAAVVVTMCASIVSVIA